MVEDLRTSEAPARRPAGSAEKLRAELLRVWGYNEFLPLQREAMAALLEGMDGIVVFPTGGGKSLCFQLPAVVAGPCIVISPLISLMHDQVQALKQLGVSAAYLNSSVEWEAAAEIVRRWRAGKLSLLYAAPERVLSGGFLSMLSDAPPKFFAIDEAHCISQWGHDFRPEYRQLSGLRKRFPDIPIHAYTATATQRVRDDIAHQLNLRQPQQFVRDFDRPNLHYRIERRTRVAEQVADILRGHAGRSGIVYCISRRDVETIAASLTKAGLKVLPYHAGLPQQERRLAQDAFSGEKIDAIVATVAFGMGIDRSNVRFVVHAAIPKSIEHYQQETGRAGRDGLPAECVLLYSAADVSKWLRVFEMAENQSPEQQAAQEQKLREMDSFASRPVCRHKYLVEYFGQTWPKESCGNCDVCGGGVAAHKDSARLVRAILTSVARIDWPRGAVYHAWLLRGDMTKEIDPRHLEHPAFGALANEKESDIRRWMDECVAAGLLQREQQYRTLRMTRAGAEFLSGGAENSGATEPVSLSASVQVDPSQRRRSRAERQASHGERGSIASMDEQAKSVFEALRAWRRQQAADEKVPPYVIFHDTTLANLSAARPASIDELKQVGGIGTAKIARYGAKVLAVIAEHCEQQGIPQNQEYRA